VLRDIKREGGGVKKSSSLKFHLSEMSSIHGSPSTHTLIANNVPMDIDSDTEAEQAVHGTHTGPGAASRHQRGSGKLSGGAEETGGGEEGKHYGGHQVGLQNRLQNWRWIRSGGSNFK